ncbi:MULTISPECIES: DUF1307 domain-containing protein [Anaerofustis]|uniref:DUF1307 domain-containing protein n=1 Tax=Anaerofustis TaxID=264995 RepID=UPI001105DF8A|nr:MULTISPECIES: DUF1307 domain-containing protein [Anaerofustis]MCO8193458.1 YehR family protein [Anaerofustis sp. NSJ-163]
MKKIFKAILVCTLILSLFSLTGCGGKEQTVILKCDYAAGVEIQATLHAKGDTIDKIKQVTSIDISNYSDKQIESLYNQNDILKKQFESIEGLTYDIKEENKVVYETIEVTFTKDNMKQLANANIFITNGSNVSKISLEKTIKQFESQGFEIVEQK